MTDPIESAEDFVRLVFADDGIPEYEVEHSNLGRNLVDGIRSRDRAVRREAMAENERLREALREIAGYDLRIYGDSVAHEMRDEARAALEGTK